MWLYNLKQNSRQNATKAFHVNVPESFFNLKVNIFKQQIVRAFTWN